MSELPFSLADLQNHFGGTVYTQSWVTGQGGALCLVRTDQGNQLAILAQPDNELLGHFQRVPHEFRSGYVLYLCPTTPQNATALRKALPFLKPQPLGLVTSAGFGDRLGLATPGHVLALTHVLESNPGKTIAPIFAQQSIREMTRTNRTPEKVLADATWGAFEAGWRGPVGADADHLKTPADIDACAAAGFSFYTFDPGAYVDNLADITLPVDIQQKITALPWDKLESSPTELRQRYVGRLIELEGLKIELTDDSVLRAAVKYGGAVAHVTAQYRYLKAKGIPFELEVSVDETETPTTHAEHYYIASELKRLGVEWVSLAPRYVGRFEKGVDYIGDLAELQADLNGHAAIARALGPYKLSLHSGSDKFRVYPLIVQATGGQVHLKTAGTSYLEGLRTIAAVKPALFKEIVAAAVECYPMDKATYHVSADLAKLPVLEELAEEAWPDLLNQFDARQVLHVTFGSILARFGEELKSTLAIYSDEYTHTLVRHFVKHLEPFLHFGAGAV